MSIYHASSGSIYNKQFNEECFQKTFNLSGAEDGLYKVEIKNGRERYSCRVNINTYTQVSRKMELQ